MADAIAIAVIAATVIMAVWSLRSGGADACATCGGACGSGCSCGACSAAETMLNRVEDRLRD